MAQTAELTPDELALLRKQFTKNRERLKMLAPEMFAASAEDPIQTDIWGGPEGANTHSDMYRAGSSFGDDAGAIDKLKGLGFKDAKRNKAGEMVVQKADGKWYKDLPAGFEDLGQMKRGVEKNIGHALPAIGTVAGAVVGAGGAIPADVATLNPAPSVAGGIVGAGAGGGIGEGARLGAGSYMGFYKPNLPKTVNDLGNATLYGMGSEAGGQAIMKIPGVGKGINWATNKGMDLARKGIAGASSLATGVPKEAAERLIARPWETMSPPTNDDLAAQINEELTRRKPEWWNKLNAGRQGFLEKHANTDVSTTPNIQAINDTMKATPVGSDGTSLLPPSQRDELKQYILDKLTTQVPGEAPVPGAVASLRTPSAPVDLPGTGVSYTPTKTVESPGGMGWDYKPTTTSKIVPEKISKDGVPVSKVVAPPVQYSPWTGDFQNHMPYRRAGDLLPQADVQGVENASIFKSNPMTRRTALEDSIDVTDRGITKGSLHTLDPEYAKTDAIYSRHKRDQGLLSPMGSEARSEAGAGSLATADNKTAQRAALDREAPDVANAGFRDRQAYEDFGQDSPLRGWLPTARSALWGTLAGSGRMATGHGLLDSAGIAAGALAASSPKAHFYTLGLGSKLVSPWTKALRQNGLRALEGPLVGAPKQTPWRIKFMNEDEDQK